jgi:SAM-dependent methyltransferase
VTDSDTSGTPFRWEDYFKATANRPPHATAERAMHALGTVPPGRRVLDLGSGSGRDSLHFLARGFRVTAVDSHPAALAELKTRAEQAGIAERLTCVCERYEKLELESESFDLINASMALPFCDPARFREVWESLRRALKPRGVFAGHFFGKHDEWAHRGEMTFLWQSELEGFLIGLEMLDFTEHELDRETPTGEHRHWHYFEVVVRKSG